jgi:hypothetical protein
MLLKQNVFYLAYFAILLVYVFFPTANTSLDAYDYAASIKWNVALAHPHHLLYNYVGRVLFVTTRFIWQEVDVLSLMKCFNALVAGFCLYILHKIIDSQSSNKLQGFLLVVSVGLCFGFWRFATENETYIFPIFLSLCGSWFFQRFLHRQSIIKLLLSGLFAGVACLFHQIHFFWWFGLAVAAFLFQRKWLHLFLFAMPAFIVPVVYWLVFARISEPVNGTAFLQFVFKSYFDGTASIGIGWQHFVLTPINFVRTFFQVHGLVSELILKNPFLLVAATIAIFCLFISFCYISVKEFFRGKMTYFAQVHAVIFLMQFGFSFFSAGNAEFMVMLPFLLAIVLAEKFKNATRPLIFLCAGLAVWNFTFGIFPNHHYSFYPSDKLVQKYSSDTSVLYVLHNRNLVLNRIYYETGQFPAGILKVPQNISQRQHFEKQIAGELKAGKTVYTNCVKPAIMFSRESFYVQKTDNQFLSAFAISPVDTLETFSGSEILYQLKLNSNERVK